jgi:predicted lysophospholipase L1 biosynthesis ABC-type transport system permease subunit
VTRFTSDRAEIVGVVGHVKQWGLDADDHHPLRAQIYIPFMQLPDAAMALTARNAEILMRFAPGAPAALANVRRALGGISSEHEIYRDKTMTAMVADDLAPRRFSMILLGSFALLALALASIGIYGVTSHLVGQKTHDIGVRIALGAGRSDVLRLVLHEGVRTAILGAALGLLAALGLTRLMTDLLYNVSATDPATYTGVVLLLIAVTVAACWVPASRAMSIDPTLALRRE